jgi:hypothetical protein
MVKLIRLTTTDQKGYFDNTFNEDIILEPNSKIALQSLTTQVNTESIVLDAQNNIIEYGAASNDVKRVVLAEGTYDKTNISDLFTDITTKFNAKMNPTSTQIGKQWQVGTQNSHVSFEIKMGSLVEPEKPEFANYVGSQNVQSTTTSGKTIWSRNGGTTDMDSFMYFKAANCKGSSTFRARINANQIPAQGGFILGYLAQCPSASTSINISDILYGIRFVDQTQPYKKIVNGVESVIVGKTPYIVSANSAQNDYLDIETRNNKVVISRHNNIVDEEFFSEPYDQVTHLFPVVIFVSSQTSLDTIKFTTDPYYHDTLVLLPESSDVEVSAIPVVKPNQPSTYYIYFQDFSLASILGFATQRIPKTDTATLNPTQGSLVFTAENYFRIKDISDAYLVELQNIKLDSYDSIKQQRMNLLHVIPQYDIVQERIVYTSQYPIFLSLNNAYKINLRQIKARILKEDLSEISTVGYSQITILIDN